MSPDPPHDTSEAVPEVIRRYFAAHDRRETDAALATFMAEARVFDDGREYVGADAIRDWLSRASTQFTYTRTLLGATNENATSWLVSNRLEGDFPGGIVDLRYRFVLKDGLIAELVIAP